MHKSCPILVQLYLVMFSTSTMAGMCFGDVTGLFFGAKNELIMNIVSALLNHGLLTDLNGATNLSCSEVHSSSGKLLPIEASGGITAYQLSNLE
ncbi:uncharacterized protein DS421_10g309890 [Arachis hypogaea]|nr:uncharacterized protein DS421_10g309890 [Arachis hypogaea]